ncbi:MAG: transglutaminase domain-containing protein [Myxococcota bacterium]
MPVTNDPNALRALINRQLADKRLNNAEADELLTEIKKDGVTDEEAKVLVEGLTPDASGVDNDADHRNAVNRVMGQVDAVKTLPLDRTNAPRLPDGTVNYMGLLTLRAQGGANLPALPQKTFGGASVGVDNSGQVLVGGRAEAISLNPTSERLLEGLWGLAKPGQLETLSPAASAALQKQLVTAIQQGLATPLQDPGKFARLAGVGAALTVLAEQSSKWDPATADAMLGFAEKVQSPMMKAIILRGLDGATLSDAQKTRRQAMAAPEGMTDLLAKFDDVRKEQATAGWNTVKGAAAELTLSGVVFSKSAEGVKSFLEGMKAFDNINSGATFDREEVTTARATLEKYIQESEQPAFVFGSFAAEAPKAAANVVSARLVAATEPSLKGNPPNLKGFPLTREQADFILKVLPNTRDAAALDKMVKSLQTAGALFSPSLPSPWGSTPNPQKPMAPAAFKLFERAVTDYQERLSGKPDGKLDYEDLSREFRSDVEDLHKTLSPKLAELSGTPPKFGNVQLSAEAATYVRGLFENKMRSSMSVENIGRAMDVFGAKYGGKLEGQGFTAFKAMTDEYMAQFPAYSFFDFNKLERIASCKVQNKPVPLCTLNGQPVNMAEFYGKVGTNVATAIDRSKLLHDWQADRWGFRARASVEILDVVAEQTARGEGPVALLLKTNPGKTVEIQATGRDGGHEQFIYVLKQGTREMGRFTQGSDGTLAAYNQATTPVLFTASIGKDGDLNVQVPSKIAADRYPLQTNYGVGDKIDLTYLDTNEVELQKEGETFKTRYKVVEATIDSFDAKGNYKVTLTNPRGEKETKTVTINDIRRANNPHYFKPTGDTFSDVTINLRTDEQLKAFLEGAKPIIQAHLPTDGSTVNLPPKELAKRQKACIDALMKYCSAKVKYPTAKDSNPDANSARYHELLSDNWAQVPLGELVKIERGVCRHQCILEHLLLQYAGIDSRLASGAANTSSNGFRGFHIWTEVSLADNDRYLSDQTWHDGAIPLWSGAYSVDKRRAEMYDRTSRYDRNVVLPN